jgi:hypothetical protein
VQVVAPQGLRVVKKPPRHHRLVVLQGHVVAVVDGARHLKLLQQLLALRGGGVVAHGPDDGGDG